MLEQYYTEQDWKLFRSRIAEWQEAYMNRLNMEYASILAAEGRPSEKFWALEKRLRTDQQSSGVCVQMRRSKLVQNLAALLSEGVISQADLEGFSDTLRDALSYLCH